MLEFGSIFWKNFRKMLVTVNVLARNCLRFGILLELKLIERLHVNVTFKAPFEHCNSEVKLSKRTSQVFVQLVVLVFMITLKIRTHFLKKWQSYWCKICYNLCRMQLHFNQHQIRFTIWVFIVTQKIIYCNIWYEMLVIHWIISQN